MKQFINETILLTHTHARKKFLQMFLNERQTRKRGENEGTSDWGRRGKEQVEVEESGESIVERPQWRGTTGQAK